MPAAPQSPQFKQHPIPLNAAYLLNANSVIVDDVAPVPAADTLLIAPPSATDVDNNGGSVIRMLSPVYSVFVGRLSAAPLLINDKIQLIYKAEGGREAVVAEQDGPQPQGEKFTLTVNNFILMSPNDGGLFLRVTEAIPTGVPRIEGTVQSFDVRNPIRSFADVTTVELAPAPGGNGNPNNAQLIYENTSNDVDVIFPSAEGAFYATLINFDDIPHTYQMYLSDGTTTIEITDTGTLPTLDANDSDSATDAVILPALPPGWSVRMSLGEAVSTFPVRAIIGHVKTNFDVARDDQGGAY